MVLPLLLLSCGEAPPPVEIAGGPPAWRLASAPAAPSGVAELKASAREGDRVTLVGRVGGRMDPVSEESGLLVLMDASVSSCADMPDENCPTPWDYCCEPAETLTANAATIQLRNAEGEPIAFEAGDVPPLSMVTVTGTVAPRPHEEVLVVEADAMHVRPG